MKLACITCCAILLIMTTNCQAPGNRSSTAVGWLAPVPIPAINQTGIQPGLAGAISGTIGDYYFLGGGANFPDAPPWGGGAKKYHADAFLFQYAPAGGLDPVRSIPEFFPHPLAYAAVAQGPGYLLVAGGETPAGLSKVCFAIKPGTAEQPLSIELLHDLPEPVANAATFYYEGNWMVAGGTTSSGTGNRVWQLRPEDEQPAWTEWPALPYPVSHAALSAHTDPSGKIAWLLAGGRSSSPGQPTTFRQQVFALLEGADWTLTDSLPHPLAAMSSVTLPGGAWLLLGGDDGTQFRGIEDLMLQRDRARDTIHLQLLRQQIARAQQAHTGFSNQIWIRKPNQNGWSLLDTIPGPAPVTTQATWQNGCIYLGSGEIKPGIRLPLILQGRLTDAVQHGSR